ncbi:hypothetical protein AUEXF2481DRAFT_1471 [Aureobasidium subglaciale EXF-2481]|uniref:RING-type domain-containing protein n=1 Tax=Aureobasidium subglaciale (strain EXF-2481) TaxID=1043005 RepID=A0A074YQQ9_AURSE|nr:uncharacterized protein AUEXF2481DRAFT_1471 [Aureobasidium subglaciale EXF-2481]KER00016.1 hypothetical protein AUEXF2481DRAFT_1471 [Aureobasidium subglaciale EXF-2481]
MEHLLHQTDINSAVRILQIQRNDTRDARAAHITTSGSIQSDVSIAFQLQPDELNTVDTTLRSNAWTIHKGKARLPFDTPLILCETCEENKIWFTVFNAPCGHRYCSECLTTLFDLCTRDEEVYPPRCCTQVSPLQLVRQGLSSELIEDFVKKSVEWKTKDRTYCYGTTCSAGSVVTLAAESSRSPQAEITSPVIVVQSSATFVALSEYLGRANAVWVMTTCSREDADQRTYHPISTADSIALPNLSSTRSIHCLNSPGGSARTLRECAKNSVKDWIIKTYSPDFRDRTLSAVLPDTPFPSFLKSRPSQRQHLQPATSGPSSPLEHYTVDTDLPHIQPLSKHLWHHHLPMPTIRVTIELAHPLHPTDATPYHHFHLL